jgi:hypothetical protein
VEGRKQHDRAVWFCEINDVGFCSSSGMLHDICLKHVARELRSTACPTILYCIVHSPGRSCDGDALFLDLCFFQRNGTGHSAS